MATIFSLALVAGQGWLVEYLDINNVFLSGSLKEEVHIRPLEGYQIAPNKICKLNNSLYGLKQTSGGWNCELTSHSQSIGVTEYLKIISYSKNELVHPS